MIFVTVGTHEQPFNRLIKEIDELKRDGIIKEDVLIQIGFSTYIPRYCSYKKLIPYQEMIKNVENSRIVITHGGPSSFIMPLQIGKIPIVVPRQEKYGEHVNDHQLVFANEVNERYHNLIVVNEVNKLGNVINNYEQIVNNIDVSVISHNQEFCKKLSKIAMELVYNGK